MSLKRTKNPRRVSTLGSTIKGLKYLYTNAHTIGDKQGELEILVCEGKYEIVPIAETWWDTTHDWNTQLEVYKLLKRNRPNKRSGWGRGGRIKK